MEALARQHDIGGRPLCENPAIGFAIVEAQARVEAAGLLAYRTARMSERGLGHRRETAQAKFFAAEALLGAVDVCNRVLGGLGGHLDTPAERYLRDAYSCVAAQGTIEKEVDGGSGDVRPARYRVSAGQRPGRNHRRWPGFSASIGFVSVPQHRPAGRMFPPDEESIRPRQFLTS